MASTTPLSTEDIEAIRADLKTNGLSRIVNMRVNRQKYAQGSISLYPSISTKANSYTWSEREFPHVLAFVRKHRLSSMNGTDYYDQEPSTVWAVYNSGFDFMAREQAS